MLGQRLFLLMGSTFLLCSATASAQTDPQAETAARALFQQADAEMAEGKFAQACPRFEEAKRLVMNHINTGIKLAECYVGQNRTASAWNELSRVRALAVTQNKTDKVEIIDERLAQVMPKVPSLRVDVPPSVASIAGISIRRGEVELGAGQWGLPLPVDPGTYTLRATAPGRKAWEQQVDVKQPETAGDKAPVVVTIGELALDESAKPKPVGEGNGPVAAPSSSMSGLRVTGIVGMSLGAVGLGVGAVLGGMAISRYGGADGHCNDNNHCDQVGFDARTEGIALGKASTAAFVAGGLVAATGVVLFAVSPKQRDESGAGQGQMSLRVGPGNVVLRGEW